MKLIYPCSDPDKFCFCHKLDSQLLDADALKVVRRLRQFEHRAYFVGGCIRYILLDRVPKDFDLVTSAHPKEIRRIFKNSRIIGKRFLLVHVFFGDKIVELATFRRAPAHKPGAPPLLLQRDNSFGTDEEDVLRRDFTINALFYDPQADVIIDYVNGIKDLQRKEIRTIGDADVRFQEDPVRIFRAIKLSAQLGFSLVPEVKQAIVRHTPLLGQASSERLLLEVLKVLQSGAAFPCFHAFAEYNVLQIITPQLSAIWKAKGHPSQLLLCQILKRLDKIPPAQRNKFSQATLLSILSLPIIFFAKQESDSVWERMEPGFCKRELAELGVQLHFSRDISEKISKIIPIQLYFEKHTEDSPKKRLFSKSYFADALDFLFIRTYQDSKNVAIYEFWHKYHRRYLRESRER